MIIFCDSYDFIHISHDSFEVIVVQFIMSGERVRRVRPVKVDGERMMMTMDYRTDRINVETENGKIVRIAGAN